MASQNVKENIDKFNKAKEELAEQGVEIRDWDLKSKKLRLVKNGEFAGYLDLKSNTLELKGEPITIMSL